MPNNRFVVKLSGKDRQHLHELISKGKAKAKTILKARFLLKADQGKSSEGWADEEIWRALDTNISMVARVREKLVTHGLDAVLTAVRKGTGQVDQLGGLRPAELLAPRWLRLSHGYPNPLWVAQRSATILTCSCRNPTGG